MAKYRVTGPDGGSYLITAPDDATAEDVQRVAAEHIGGAAPADRGALDYATNALRTFNQSMTFGAADKLAAGVKALPALFDERDFGDVYRTELDREQAGRRQFREENPTAAALAEGTGAAATMAIPGLGVSQIGTQGGRAVGREAMRVAGLQGAAYGAGTTETQRGDTAGDVLMRAGENAVTVGVPSAIVGGVVAKGLQGTGRVLDIAGEAITKYRSPANAAMTKVNQALRDSGTNASRMLADFVPGVNRQGGGTVPPDIAIEAYDIYARAVGRGQSITAARQAAANHIRQAVTLRSGQAPSASTADSYIGEIRSGVDRNAGSPLMLGEVARRGAGDEEIAAAASADLLEAIGTTPNTPGSKAVSDAITRRQQLSRGRVQQVFRSLVGEDDVPAAIVRNQQQVRDIGDVLYGDAFRKEAPFADALIRTVQRWQRIAGTRGGVPGEKLQEAIDTIARKMGTDEGGAPSRAVANRLRAFIEDRASVRALKDRLQTGTAEHTLVSRFYQAISDAVGRRNPAWRAATNAYGEGFANTTRATEIGEQLFRSRGTGVGHVIRAIDRMSAEQKQGVRLGYVQALQQRLDETVDGGDMTRLFNNDNARRILRSLFDDDGARAILQALRDERIANQQNRRLYGSPTASRMAMQRERSIDAQVAGASDLMSPAGIMRAAGKRLTAGYERGRDRESARLLTTPLGSPDDYIATLRALAEQEGRTLGNRLAPARPPRAVRYPRRGVQGVVIGGRPLQGAANDREESPQKGAQRTSELKSRDPRLREQALAWLAKQMGDDREAYRRAGKYIDALDLSPAGTAFVIDDGMAQMSRGNVALGAGMVALGVTPQGRLAKKAGLSIAPGARLSRARDMGFDVNLPVYHGTATDFDAFDLGKGGRTTQSRVGSMGVSVSPSPDVANEFAELAARSGGDPRVLKLFQRSNKRAAVELDGSETNNEIAATLASAWDNGFDLVILKNYTTPNGVPGQTVLIVKDPSQLRSVNALFNPAKRASADLLAGLGGGALLVGGNRLAAGDE